MQKVFGDAQYKNSRNQRKVPNMFACVLEID